MITEQEIEKIRKILDDTHRPLILFDDDPDGLTSFLMIYRYIGDGRGVPIKTSPELNEQYLKIVEEYAPDRIIILDKPQVANGFITKAKVPILWIDHHPITDESKKVDYFNPLINDPKDNSPTSYWVYKIINDKKFLWLGMAGSVADWYVPDFKEEFCKEYENLFNKKIIDSAQALFDSKIGKLARILDFCLKGTSKQVKTNIKILTRIQDPYEILDEKTSQGKFILKHAKRFQNEYDKVIKSVKNTDEKLIAYKYQNDRMSFSAMLSNELLYRYPNTFIFVCREKSGFLHCSLRAKHYNVRALLDKIIKEFEQSYGGGHEHACGANVLAKDYSHFVARIKEEMDDYKEK